MMIELSNVQEARLEDLFFDLQMVPNLLENIKFSIGDINYPDGADEVNRRLDCLHFLVTALMDYFRMVQPLVDKYYWIERDLEKARENLSKASDVVALLEKEALKQRGDQSECERN